MRTRTALTVLSILASLATGCAAESPDGEQSTDESNTTAAAASEGQAPAADVFASADGWTIARSDEEVVQRYKIIDGAIYCESKMHVRGTVASAVSLLRSEWTWYDGTVEDFIIHPDGTRTYHLWPTGKLGLVNVFETMSAPKTLRGGGARIEVELDGYAQGLAYVEIHPVSSGGITLTGRFAGVRSTVLPTLFFTTKHLEAEGGKLGFPFYREGGGFAGLKTAIERGH